MFQEKHYYQVLLVAAVILLWGGMACNGTLVALVKAAWSGVLDDGRRLRTRYTGVLLVDFPISILVAFFFTGTNGTHRVYQLFVMDVYSVLQPAFVWLYTEELSGRSEHRSLTPIIWGLAWQAFGGAVAFPGYFLVRLLVNATQDESGTKGRDRIVRNNAPARDQKDAGESVMASARALPLSFLVGAVLPAVMGMMPTWQLRSDEKHQIILALWSADPIWVSLSQRLLVRIQTRWMPPIKTSRATTRWWIRAALLLSAVVAGITHVYVLACLMLETGGDLNELVGIYFAHAPPPVGVDAVLTRGPWLFLKHDWIIMSLSSLGWVLLQVQKAQCSPPSVQNWVSMLVMGLMGLMGWLLLGAGSTVSLVMFWKEGLTQVREAKAAKGEHHYD